MTTCYFEREQYNTLRLLSRTSKIPMAVLIREGVELVLERRRAQLPPDLEPVVHDVSGVRD